jgi:hypothetical protein
MHKINTSAKKTLFTNLYVEKRRKKKSQRIPALGVGKATKPERNTVKTYTVYFD